MKVKVLKSFNRIPVGTVLTCNKKEYDSWLAHGWIEKVEEPQEKKAMPKIKKVIMGADEVTK